MPASSGYFLLVLCTIGVHGAVSFWLESGEVDMNAENRSKFSTSVCVFFFFLVFRFDQFSKNYEEFSQKRPFFPLPSSFKTTDFRYKLVLFYTLFLLKK